jgi:hypothetical protein
MRALTFALLLLTILAAAAEKRFSRIVIETNVLALGEVSFVHLSGAAQPLTFALMPDGSPKELEIGAGSESLPIQAAIARDDAGVLIIEVKAAKPFRGSLIIRDAEGRKADLKFYAGDEKLLRELSKPRAN